MTANKNQTTTGITYGETFTDDDGTCWHQVLVYEDGQCTDRYVTRAPRPPADPFACIPNADDSQNARY